MIKAKFKHVIDGEEVKIVAKAKDVDSYGAVGLTLRFTDLSGETVNVVYKKKLFEEIEEIASELLYERKYEKELEF